MSKQSATADRHTTAADASAVRQGSPDAAPSPGDDSTAATGNAPGFARGTSDRRILYGAIAILSTCSVLIGFAIFDTREDDPKKKPIPTSSVTYRVEGNGSVDIRYLGAGTGSKAKVVKKVELPWRTTVRVPHGREPSLQLVLGQGGGTARCWIVVAGQQSRSSTAFGSFGRATCSAMLPKLAPSGSDGPAG